MGSFNSTTLRNDVSDFAGAVNNGPGYARGISTINVDGLDASKSYLAGHTFQITGDGTVYKVTANATSSAGGAITGLTFWPPLNYAVADNAVVTFSVPTIDVRGLDEITVRVSGANGTYTPEASIDGTNWFGIGVTPVTSTTMATTFNADGVWRIDTRGIRNLRVRVTTPGTATTSTFYWSSL